MLENQSNIILIDWFTFVSRIHSVDSIKRMIGLADQTWEEQDYGLWGYPRSICFNHIRILYGASAEMGVCCTMSGQGCREFESYSSVSWSSVFEDILSENSDDIYATRIDLAFDDHTGILDMEQLIDDTDDHNYTKRGEYWEVRYGSVGATIYHGAPSSNTRLRIYDKASERGCQDDTHWIRVELELKSTSAHGCLEKLVSMDTGVLFRGILKNYITYRTPSSDTNRSRWPVAPYWEELLDGVEAVHVWSYPGVEYNVFRLTKYLVHQAGPSILCFSDIIGLDQLLSEIKCRHQRLSPKYMKLISEYNLLKSSSTSDLEVYENSEKEEEFYEKDTCC